MSRRSVLVVLAALGGVLVALRLRRDRRRERVTVGYEDGSSVTVEAGAPAADRLLEIARTAVPA
jgi:hypothetical protein